ncbi:MAG: YmdB family metallophosphoesterase, partial [Verrucomicrobiota bacterium]|nr:YmdB family metallophosphoesterase [Verrucomicrobiota bacterium]
KLGNDIDAIVVDIHAEATSEKVAMGHYCDGRASLVVGTHTHVPTADGRILPRGTAYLSDAGMCGPYASVLGRDVGQVVATFLDGMKRRFPVAEDDVRISGCLIEIDPSTGLSLSIKRVELAK